MNWRLVLMYFSTTLSLPLTAIITSKMIYSLSHCTKHHNTVTLLVKQ